MTERDEQAGPSVQADEGLEGSARGDRDAGPSSRDQRLSSGITACLGATLVAAFFGLAQTAPGLDITFQPPFTRCSTGELNTWLGVALLLTPGGALLGWSCARWTMPSLAAAWHRLGAMDRLERQVGGCFVAAMAFVVARVGRAVILLDHPVTDDERGARFGGQILATGRWTIPLPDPPESLPGLFLHARDGMVSSFEWLGLQAAWALSEATGTGPVVFCVASAAGTAALAWVLARRLGPSWGAVGAALLLLSPMGFTLSLTTHGQLLSRAALTTSFALLIEADARGGKWRWFALGFSSGIAVLCRPFESVFFLAPFFLWLGGRAWRGGAQDRARLGWIALGGLLPLLAFLGFNEIMTGDALLPARLTMYSFPARHDGHNGTLLERFGGNTSYHLLMLGVWFLGPVGVLLVALGVGVDRWTRLAGLAVLSQLSLTLFHDDAGIHFVGPIHSSECAPALVFIAVHGMHRLSEFARGSGLDVERWASALLAALVVGLGVFDAQHAAALRRMVEVHRWTDELLRDAHLGRAVVLAPPFHEVWRAEPDFAAVGGYVFEWAPPRPDFVDEVVVLLDGAGHHERLRSQFPGRRWFRLVPTGADGPVHFVPLE